MTNSKLSKYEFVKDVPKNIVRIPTFLSGDFGKDFLEEYQAIAKADYKNADVLNVLNESNGWIKGSNDYSVVLANKILRQLGLRTSTQADIEKILKSGDLALSGFYVDNGLAIRSEGGPNEYLAKDLIKQLRKQKLPVMIPLCGFDLRLDKNSPSGLAFNIREDAEIIYDEILNSENGNFSSEDINEKTGLPSKLGKGDRTFYSRNSGVSGVYLGRGSYLNSHGGNLDNSSDDGRVVVVAPKIFPREESKEISGDDSLVCENLKGE